MALSATQTLVVGALISGAAVFVLLASAAFVAHGAAQLRPRANRLQWALHAVIALWAGTALAVSVLVPLSFTLLIPFALTPIVVGTLLTFTPRVAELLRAIPTPWLVLLQSYRFVGAVFIVPFLTEGVLTQGFALNAGIGDMITGLAAPLVAWALARRVAGSTWVFLAWTAFGILDLIVAPVSAAVYGFGTPDAEIAFPVTFIPLFLGPPLGILIHLVTLRGFWLRRGQRAGAAA